MADQAKEKRAYRRQEYDTTLNIRTGGEMITGKLRNISPGGVKFGSNAFIMPMTRISFTFADESPLEFSGIVIWTLRVNSHCETGVFFQDLTPEQGEWLDSFCGRLDTEG